MSCRKWEICIALSEEISCGVIWDKFWFWLEKTKIEVLIYIPKYCPISTNIYNVAQIPNELNFLPKYGLTKYIFFLLLGKYFRKPLKVIKVGNFMIQNIIRQFCSVCVQRLNVFCTTYIKLSTVAEQYNEQKKVGVHSLYRSIRYIETKVLFFTNNLKFSLKNTWTHLY